MDTLEQERFEISAFHMNSSVMEWCFRITYSEKELHNGKRISALQGAGKAWLAILSN